MKLKVSLFDGTLTIAQQAIVGLWVLGLIGVAALWSFGSLSLLTVGFSGAMLSLGRLLGLLATYFALTQFMLMGRISWIERSFGLDRLASYHRLNGYMAIILIVLHPIFIVGSYAAASGQNYFAQYLQTLQTQPYAWLALIAEILFVTVVISSIYIARKHLKFETWYYVHLMVYVAITIVPFHQFVSSPELAGSTFGQAYWLFLYAFVAFNVLIWRFGLLIYNYQKFDFRIAKVVAETATTTSVYIQASGLERLRFTPGQFVMVRIFTKQLWWQEHPFSVSWVPKDNQLRLTIRKVGDYTTDIVDLKPGARLFVAGPFGRFTDKVATTKKRLYIAGGVGITPIRAMAEVAVSNKTDAVLLYASRTPDDTPLKDELDELAKNASFSVTYVYSDAQNIPGAQTGRIDGERIKKLVKDVKTRDVYVCGPPPMMAAIVASLKELGVPDEQIHFEQFALHS